MNELNGQTLPLDYFKLDAELQKKFFGTMGEAAIELQDVANALESQNVDWLKGCKDLATYYRTLSQNLVASQQLIFNRNVFGNDDVTFAKD